MLTLSFDQGTLLLDGLDRNIPATPPGFIWDERVKSWRTEGFRYRSIVLWLRRNNISFIDRARQYDSKGLRLEPVTVLQLFDYQEQAIGAWRRQTEAYAGRAQKISRL
jgi:Xeroderma pigmentosum group B helicase damage recognition domain